jgi:hypothetical protein
MVSSVKNQQKVRRAFDSILRSDYISLDKIESLTTLENYYIDFYNNIGSLLQRQDNFISGRRGTGKTALLLRGYYECLKTVSPKVRENSDYFEKDEKILPIFIDLSTCNDLFDSENDLDLLEIHFVRQIIESMKRQLDVIYEKKFLGFIKQNNPALEDLEIIEKILVEGMTLTNGKNRSVSHKSTSSTSGSFASKLTSFNPQIESELTGSKGTEEISQYDQVKGLNVQEFLNKINDIRKNAEIDCIYIFIDEFSDLKIESQIKFANLLKGLLASKINMYFKIGTITERYDFGDKIRIGRDLFHIPLDLNEYVERYGGIVLAIKKMEQFIEMLVNKRLEIFCPGIKYEDIFSMKKEILFHRIARETLGVPRTIGIILQQAWIQSLTHEEKNNKIGLIEINFGMRSARKMYYKQFEGSVKKGLIPNHYMDLWNSILNRAILEKNKLPDRPASHFMIDPVRKEYLNIFCENFLIHYLEENRTSKYGGSYPLFSLDYDICLDNSIKYAEIKDEFTSARFIYDDVLMQYDPYFIKEKIKSYQCPECGKIYEEQEVAHAKIKRCFDDDNILKEIIHKDVPRTQGNYTEVETKIVGIIGSLDIEEAMSAQEIADSVGCSRQKVAAWCSKVLTKKQIINIVIKLNKNYYYDRPTLTDECSDN